MFGDAKSQSETHFTELSVSRDTCARNLVMPKVFIREREKKFVKKLAGLHNPLRIGSETIAPISLHEFFAFKQFREKFGSGVNHHSEHLVGVAEILYFRATRIVPSVLS